MLTIAIALSREVGMLVIESLLPSAIANDLWSILKSFDVPVSLTPKCVDHCRIELTALSSEVLTGATCIEFGWSSSEWSLVEKSKSGNSGAWFGLGLLSMIAVCCKSWTYSAQQYNYQNIWTRVNQSKTEHDCLISYFRVSNGVQFA